MGLAVLLQLVVLLIVATGGFSAVAEQTSSICSGPRFPNDIVRENCLQGSPSSEWDVNGAGDVEIQGFAVPFGVSPGGTVYFKVKSVSDKYRVDIYRLGYYKGLGARLVGSVRPHVNLPQEQPECFRDNNTHMYDCGTWHVSARWNVPANVTSGMYVGRLTREDDLPPNPVGASWRTDYSQEGLDIMFARPRADLEPDDPSELKSSYGQQKRARGEKNLHTALREPRASHIYFVVRNLDSKAEVLFQTSDTTWQAYNRYGGTSLYGSYREGFPKPRTYVASYNRPFENRAYRAVNLVFANEYPAIRFFERNGFDLAYMSGLDVHRFGEKITQHKVYLSVGHDEYWSLQQRRHVEAARDAGVHMMFLSGNEAFWGIRWESTPTYTSGKASVELRNEMDNIALEEPRSMVCYKETQDIQKIDPHPTLWTGTFRDSRPINPQGSLPENSLTGQIFTVNAWRNDVLTVPRRFARLPIWSNAHAVTKLLDEPPLRLASDYTYLGTQPVIGRGWVEPWSILKQGLLGHEWDEDLDNGYRPSGMIRMSETHADNVQYIQDSGATYDTGSATHRLTFYRAGFSQQREQQPSNGKENECDSISGSEFNNSSAIVFGAGTVQWTWGLDPMRDDESALISQVQNSYDTRVGLDLAGPDRAVQQATINIFSLMGVQPATMENGLMPGPAQPKLTDEWLTGVSCEVTEFAPSSPTTRGIVETPGQGRVVRVRVNAPMGVLIAGVEVRGFEDDDSSYGSEESNLSSPEDDVSWWRAGSHDLAYFAQLMSTADLSTMIAFDLDPSWGRRWTVAWLAKSSPRKFACRVTNEHLQTSPAFYTSLPSLS